LFVSYREQTVNGSAGNHPAPPPILPPEREVSILASSLVLANADYSWRREALCRDTDPDLFFPVGTTGNALVQIERAKEVCSECPVNRECLDYALETNQDSGIWGGTSEEERRILRRRYVARQRSSMPA
jgi:WhiB family redox-sensing transcriptional regulator